MTRKRRKPPAKRRSKAEPADASFAKTTQESASGGASIGRLSKRGLWLLALVVPALVVVGGLVFQYAGGGSGNARTGGTSVGSVASATFVGSETCSGCHSAEAELWHGSQHKHAIDHATDKSVLGDFADAGFDYYGVKSRFFRRDGKFLVETDGADGKLSTFEIKYTFGVDPLQQYLVEFPDGRLQAL